MEVAIMGKGFVGSATKYFLEEYCKDTVTEIHIEDPGYSMYIDDRTWDRVRYTFICVPTDNDGVNNHLNLTILMKALRRAKGIPVIRSTVGPDSLITLAMSVNHDIPLMHWPEFLREKHWQDDVDDKSIPVVIGGKEELNLERISVGEPGEGNKSFYSHNVASLETIEDAVRIAKFEQKNWSDTKAQKIYEIMGNVAKNMEIDRARIIAAMIRDSGKTIAEANTEVSEAIDFARLYGLSLIHI